MTGHWSWAVLLLGIWVGVVAAPARALEPGASDASEIRLLQPAEPAGVGETEPAAAGKTEPAGPSA
ncbi:MAG: hypothetical protein JRS35_16080, partial [Deltaproteobacteria bacterium]|nr:hypothetical protein [Deltaproteobacteria bacterium]